jgi:hypothetical protein
VIILLTSLSALSPEASSGQTILRVDADAPPGGDGTSWPNAIDDLVVALATAAIIPETVEIWVAENTYNPDSGTGDINRSFDLPGDVQLLGGFAGDENSAEERDPSVHETILSGDLLGDDTPGWGNRSDNSLQVLRAQDLSAPSLIDGFTVTGGNADFEGGDLLGGGGIFVERSDLEVHGCLFVENTAGTLEPSLGNLGAAIYIKGFGTLSVDACRFEHNRANQGGAIGAYGPSGGPVDVFVSDSVFDENDVPTQSGGAIRFFGRALVVERCEFTDQHAGYGGAIHTGGNDRLEIRDCTFARNIVDVKNAALWVSTADNGDLTPAVIERCEFLDNWTDGGFPGGVMSLEETITHMSDCTFRGNFNVREDIEGISGAGTVSVTFEVGHEFRNCLFVDNFSGFIGGLELVSAQAEFINCDFVNNRSASTFPAASGIAAGESSFTVDNTIFWNNRVGVGVNDDLPGMGGESAQISLHSGSVLTINHSLVEGWTGSFGGIGNIGDDPLFIDEAGGNLRLTEDSPAVDAGNNAAVPPDLLHDLDGNPRIVDGDGDEIAVVDMGVYEFNGDVSDVEGPVSDVARGLELFPARIDGDRVQMRYHLAGESDVELAVFDVRGRKVRVLASGAQPGGEHTISWNGTDAAGQRVASGAYFVRLVAGNAVRSQRVVLVR